MARKNSILPKATEEEKVDSITIDIPITDDEMTATLEEAAEVVNEIADKKGSERYQRRVAEAQSQITEVADRGSFKYRFRAIEQRLDALEAQAAGVEEYSVSREQYNTLLASVDEK